MIEYVADVVPKGSSTPVRRSAGLTSSQDQLSRTKWVPPRGAGGPLSAPTARPVAPPAPPGPSPPASLPSPAASKPAAAAPPLGWDLVKTHRWDDLWYFCGERPSGFSTKLTLRARGYAKAASLAWRVASGGDKVRFASAPAGSEVQVESTKGSSRADDVSVEVSEGGGPTAPAFSGKLSVLKPHRLLPRGAPVDVAGAPAWSPAPPGAVAYWTRLRYRVVDNLGGTIVGATVNERFPAAKVNDQANNWENPAAFATTPFWPETDGTFEDNWFHWGGAPVPVAPAAPAAGQKVDHMPHEFYVGSRTPGKGCRVQTHVAQRYLGFARHEHIVSPAP